MMRVLVSGYGVMTSGLVPHLARLPDTSVALLSRHQLTSPCPGVEVVTVEDVIAAPADVVLGCFESDERSRAFWTTPQVRDGVAEANAACIEMSTLSHPWVLEWHDLLASTGGISIESPVTGSRPGATDGTLSAFVYESAKDARADRVLGAFTRKRYRFGTAGNPTRFKLVYNAWGAALLHTLAAFVPTLYSGLTDDFDVAREILKSDGWMSLVCASKLDRMTSSDFSDPDFALRHMVKDLRYSQKILGDNDLIALVLAAFLRTQEIHGGDVDFTAVAGGEWS
jgi:3-hydroxyisobutyrate dehydrogenase